MGGPDYCDNTTCGTNCHKDVVAIWSLDKCESQPGVGCCQCNQVGYECLVDAGAPAGTQCNNVYVSRTKVGPLPSDCVRVGNTWNYRCVQD